MIFVGKLIVSKGVDLLLAAWPLVHRANPGARLLMVGFGALEPGASRRLGRPRARRPRPGAGARRAGRGLEGGEEERLAMLSAFLDRLPADYADCGPRRGGQRPLRRPARARRGRGSRVLLDALVFPSTFPEAFGMVAAEAASAGALPVSAAHSGCRRGQPGARRGAARRRRALVSFELGDDAVDAIAAAAARLARARAARIAGRRAPRCATPSSGSGAGKRSPAACSTRRPGRLDELPASRRAIEPVETSSVATSDGRRSRSIESRLGDPPDAISGWSRR